MSLPTIEVKLEGGRRTYRPGDVLSGEYWIRSSDDQTVRAVELSVLWYTEGKGDEDLAVHHFQRLECSSDHPLDMTQPCSFRAVLPNSPLTYEGVLIKIRWCVRVRVFLGRGKEFFVEEPFQLGAVPSARDLVSAASTIEASCEASLS